MQARTWWVLGCVFGFVGVLGGAFGAHALEDMVSPDRLDTWSVGTNYLQIHGLALVCLGLARTGWAHRGLDVAGVAFTLGTCLFSGSLWALVLLDLPMLGAITPFGGVCFLVGWLAALVGGWGAFAPSS